MVARYYQAHALFSEDILLESLCGSASRIRFSVAVDSNFSINASRAIAFPSEAAILLPLPVSEKQQQQHHGSSSNGYITSPVRPPDVRIPHDDESPSPGMVSMIPPTQQH